MAGKNTAVFGLYNDRTQVDSGVHALLTAGFRNEDISVLFPDNEGTKDFGLENTGLESDPKVNPNPDPKDTRPPQKSL